MNFVENNVTVGHFRNDDNVDVHTLILDLYEIYNF